MSTPPHYQATLDPETGKYFFTTPTSRTSGWKFQKSCQNLADKVKAEDERAALAQGSQPTKSP